MRDGVHLSADIYLPTTGDGPWPALLLRTIYNNNEPRYLNWMERFVQAGYAVVLQDCRGRHDSDGDWEPYECEIPDGYDTHEWVGQQPWCNGRIGTFGLSYPGFTQTAPATLRSKYLKALVPIASQQDNYGHHRVDGVIAHATSLFFANMMARTMQTEALNRLDWDAIYRHLPIVESLDLIGDCPYYRGVVQNEQYGKFWSNYSLRNKYEEVEAPALFITGWYDSLLHETITVYNGWHRRGGSEEARNRSKLLIGPWSHQVAPWGRKPLGEDGEFEDVVFGKHAVGDIYDIHLRWYDAVLKGIGTGIDAEPPVKIFVMGRNEWRHEDEYPLARTEWTRIYLHGTGPGDAQEDQLGNGSLSFEKPTGSEPPDRFRYDPDDPAPSWGAQYQSMDRGGPRDRREIERRADVLVYTSEPLKQDLEVTGPVSAVIYASSSAVDTDFTAALVDVFPDGRAIILCEGICRARFRNGTDKPELMQPAQVYEFKIDMWDTSNVFLAGHRVRVEVSSSNFPRYNRNLNTGNPIATDTEVRVAHQTVFHDAERPSHVVLPVIPV
jgi:putative CocE/NonD family hydrolase